MTEQSDLALKENGTEPADGSMPTTDSRRRRKVKEDEQKVIEPVMDPAKPAFEIDPDVDLGLQLLLVQQQLQELRNGRYQLYLRNRVNLSFKNKEATKANTEAMLVQEDAIVDFEANVAFLQAEIKKESTKE